MISKTQMVRLSKRDKNDLKRISENLNTKYADTDSVYTMTSLIKDEFRQMLIENGLVNITPSGK